jgi:Predicted S-adenosylmethionine-dependent methyltransferase
LDKCLKSGGKFFFKTDHLDYYKYVLEISKQLDNYKLLFNTEDLYSTEKINDNIQTEFEQMFLSKHKMNIKYIEFEKK